MQNLRILKDTSFSVESNFSQKRAIIEFHSENIVLVGEERVFVRNGEKERRAILNIIEVLFFFFG